MVNFHANRRARGALGALAGTASRRTATQSVYRKDAGN
jgi:hypothetical protein